MEPQRDSNLYVLSFTCLECGSRWDDLRERWRIYFTDDDPPLPATYCPPCAEREFGD